VLLYGPQVSEDKLPRLAIRPYPNQYIWNWTAKDGSDVVIRPIRPEDELMMVKFHETLSDRSVYMRYMHPMLLSQRAAHERLSRICHGDYDREITLVAEKHDPQSKESSILAAARMSKMHGMNEARFTVLVSDLSHGMGLGSQLVKRLVDVGRAEKLERLNAEMTPDNQAMRSIFERLGFEIKPEGNNHLVSASLKL
jgi:acetyltransferase